MKTATQAASGCSVHLSKGLSGVDIFNEVKIEDPMEEHSLCFRQCTLYVCCGVACVAYSHHELMMNLFF